MTVKPCLNHRFKFRGQPEQKVDGHIFIIPLPLVYIANVVFRFGFKDKIEFLQM